MLDRSCSTWFPFFLYIYVFLYFHLYFQDSTMRKSYSHASRKLKMLKQKEDEVGV